METKERADYSRIGTLSGKRVVLLGGTSGFGFATAQAAAQEGASVVVVSSKQEKVDKAVARLPQGTEGYSVDLSNEEQVRDFFNRIGEFDHLVYTAGESLLLEELDMINVQQARRFFDIRYWGALIAAKYGNGNIRPGGSIVLVSGTGASRPQKGWLLVSSVLSAVEALTRALAVELAPIRVNAVCAGVVRTELWNNMPEKARESMYESVGKSLLVGRVGEAEDVAETFLYLMREKYSTGQIVVIDGGSSLV